MKLNGVHHINIRCAVSDLPAIEKFYGELMGMKKGARPNFPNDGIWLWHDNPLVGTRQMRAPVVLLCPSAAPIGSAIRMRVMVVYIDI